MKIATISFSLNNKLSMKRKILLSYIFLILVPACLLMLFYYQRSSNIIESEVTNSILQTLKQTELNISYKLDGVENVSNMLSMNKDIYTFLGQDDVNMPIGQKIDDGKNILKILTAAQNSKDIYKIRLFIDGKKLFSGELNSLFPIEMAQSEDWYNDAVDNNGKLTWRNTYYVRYINNDYAHVISCIRMLRNPDKYDDLVGILSVDMPEESIYEIISKIDVTQKQNIFVTDKNGVIISCSDKSRIGANFLKSNEELRKQNADEGIFKVGNGVNSAFVIYTSITKNGWKIVAKVPVEEISKSNNTFNSISGIILIVTSLIIFMLALFLFAAFLTEGMNKRIKSLIHNMEKEGVKSIADGSTESQGDIYQLEKNFDTMISTVKRLTEESYQAKLHEREAELKALQAQINPHFLYNTLDMINWMAVRRDAQDISEMIDTLAKYFRYSLNKGKDIVSVSDEMELAKAYLAIQKKRLGDTFDVSFKISEDVKQHFLPKLILQPIIENAILHGIQQKNDGCGFITIEAVKSDTDIIISISDNGAGITEERMRGLLISENPNECKSYGLYNINQRIKLFFGNEYGLAIASIPGQGTKVEVKIKAIEKP